MRQEERKRTVVMALRKEVSPAQMTPENGGVPSSSMCEIRMSPMQAKSRPMI